jgi:hypothetical protein
VTTRLPPGRHRDLLEQAIEVEAGAQRALLAGDLAAAQPAFREAAALYRESFACAPPGGFGRLVGMVKASVFAGDPHEAATHARAAVASADPSPTVGYVRALASVVLGDDAGVAAATTLMRAGSDAFGRAAEGLDAIASRDDTAFAAAVDAIVADFTARAAHLTTVPIADTAAMLQWLAAPCGLRHEVDSPLLPGVPPPAPKA